MKTVVEGRLDKNDSEYKVERHADTAEVLLEEQLETNAEPGLSRNTTSDVTARPPLEETQKPKAQKLQAYLLKRKSNNAFWSARAVQYGKSLTATASTSWVRSASLRRLRNIVRPSDSTLEIGCGNASSLLGPLSEDCRTFGVDLTEEMLSVAKKHHVKIQGLARADARELPFKTASFDVVYTSRCLINLLDPEVQRMAIREALRVTKPSGIVILIENFEEPVARMRRQGGDGTWDENNLLLSLRKTMHLCRELGWHPVRIHGNTLASFVAHSVVGRMPRGQRFVEWLLSPLCGALTRIEDAFGRRLPLVGKDTMIAFSKSRKAMLSPLVTSNHPTTVERMSV